jgi:methylated-DNA-[protein]-cysteine S-methyltransferase
VGTPKNRNVREGHRERSGTADDPELQLGTASSPVGIVHFALHQGALCAVGFDEGWEELLLAVRDRLRDHPSPGRTARVTVRECREAFQRYFNGDLRALDPLPVHPRGTPFQERVWKALRSIPVGSTISYGELAGRIGSPKASRAVGAANGANPISVVLPCHRVIGSGGSLVGYGGGLERKVWLLKHEGALPAELPT